MPRAAPFSRTYITVASTTAHHSVVTISITATTITNYYHYRQLPPLPPSSSCVLVTADVVAEAQLACMHFNTREERRGCIDTPLEEGLKLE